MNFVTVIIYRTVLKKSKVEDGVREEKKNHEAVLVNRIFIDFVVSF